MVNSKRKGSAMERQLCKALSLWVSQGVSEDWFWRSSLSGGRATVAKKFGRVVNQCGDICSVDPRGFALTDVFFIESKHVKKHQLDKFLMEGTGLLAAFWKQAKKQAADHKREPMLIAKENHGPTIVITRKNALRKICLTPGGAITVDPEVRLFSIMLNYKFGVMS